MRSEIDLTVTVFALCGIWFLWDIGIKKLFLDQYRERLFELRFSLVEMADSGEIDVNDDAYRSVEMLLCGLLRFGHRLTFMSFIFHSMEQERARKSKGYVEHAHQINLKISRLPFATQQKLNSLLAEVHVAVWKYVSFSSLLFMAGTLVVYALRAFDFCQDLTRRNVSGVFETAAYRAEETGSGRALAT